VGFFENNWLLIGCAIMIDVADQFVNQRVSWDRRRATPTSARFTHRGYVNYCSNRTHYTLNV